jgi:hypothetical protein
LNITNRFQDIGFTFIASVVSRIRWTAVPKEASGIYQCRDSNDVSQSTSNATLIVASKQLKFGRWLIVLLELTLYMFSRFCFPVLFLTGLILFVRIFIPSTQNFGFFRLELFMSTGSRDKFFVGHLIAWYFHEMLYRIWKKSINQRRNKSKRGNRVSMFKICDLNIVISKLWKYKQSTTEKWNDDISITIRLVSSQKQSQHFRGEPVSFHRRKEFYYKAVTPVAKMSCDEKNKTKFKKSCSFFKKNFIFLWHAPPWVDCRSELVARVGIFCHILLSSHFCIIWHW